MPTYNESLTVNGMADEIQVKVKGNATQNAALQEWQQNSGATPLARITGDGKLQVGSVNSLTANENALVQAHRAEADTGKPKRGLNIAGYLTGALNDAVTWVVQDLILKGTGGISVLHTALRSLLRNENTGIMDGGSGYAELRAGDIGIENAGGNSESLVPNLTGLRVGISNESGGYADTAYGIKVEVTNAGQLNTVYALYTDTGLVHVEDAVELKRLTIVPATPPADHVRVYGKTDGRVYAKNWLGSEAIVTTFSKRIEIDFGSLGTRSKTFTISDPDVLLTSQVTAVQSGTAATGRAQDENEMDVLNLRCVSGSEEFTLYADSLLGPVAGRYVIDYRIS
jgi:hypothetical protein